MAKIIPIAAKCQGEDAANSAVTGPFVPRTPEEWRTVIDNETTGKRGRFRFLERQIFSSRAYRSLPLPAREILHCYLNKIHYKKPPKQRGSGQRRKAGAAVNGNQLIVTNGEIAARGGVTSASTMGKCRDLLWEIGFLDVGRWGAFPQPGVYALSHRFLLYPDGDFRPKIQKPTVSPRYARKCPPGVRGFPSNSKPGRQ